MGSINKQHMTIHWKHIVKDDDSVPSTEATLKEKATLVGRVGLMMLSVGTGAWRVRNSMNEVAWESRVPQISVCCPLSIPAMRRTEHILIRSRCPPQA